MATHRGISSLVDGQFSGIYTSSKEKLATGFEMKSSYHPGEDAILLSYSLSRTGQVEARLYGMDGSLVGQWNDLPGFNGLNQVKLPSQGMAAGNWHPESISSAWHMVEGPMRINW